MTDWNAAADDAFCHVLDVLGPSMLGYGVYSLAGGPATTTAYWALTGAAFLANAALCPDQPAGYPPLPPGFNEGCLEVETTGALMAQNLQFPETVVSLGFDAHKIVRIEKPLDAEGNATTGSIVVFTTSPDSEETLSTGTAWNPSDANYYIVASNPEECVTPNREPPKDFPDVAPYQYIDQSTNCTYNLKPVGLVQDTDNSPAGPVFEISSAPAESFAAGGRIGGCFMEPFIFYKPPGGPGTPILPPPGGPPFPPSPGGGPWWLELLKKAAPVAAGNLVAQLVKGLATQKLPKANFKFVAPCDKDEAGEPLYKEFEMPSQNFESRVVTNQAVIMDILQQHLDWKTPVCFPKHEKGTYARSITFQSDENTERGNSRLTKRFGYRSNTACDLEQLYEHWRSFVWNTGPVIVKHSGSPLGSPQVWAASVDEGKRVIQHAGREAGIDPNQVGEWSTGSSDNPRYGLSHTVKLMEVKGLWQATAREGPDGYAEAIWTMPGL